ncbi:uncharacterized protein K02A2.6-like [Macrosteles quadrilineatus]|uniref:uncharacterized protein K02A2.6-like n=1 Tax=Macrosteles quadrilineatus TaxID=74068 RepID=UPI0023E2682D|nr:uncharacterized protein K02A2.6-like [Macrosteles quadrilineatus]
MTSPMGLNEEIDSSSNAADCENAFVKGKDLLLSDRILIPFNPKLDLVVTADASPYGVGALISHRLPDNSERPVAFASRTLSPQEQRYPQIEREALALVFAVKKFHTFLYGRHFLMVTDHRPLTYLLGPTKNIPTLAAARVQRWAIILSTYNYDLVYKKGSEIPNADALSRLPCGNNSCDDDEGEVNFFAATDELPITYKEISTATRYDPILSKVLDFTMHGWPNSTNDAQLTPYITRSSELSVDRDCLLWGRRVIVPEPYRKEIMMLLHKEHPGETRMKSLARSYVWWPNLDRDLEGVVKTCKICQTTRNSSSLTPLQQWSWTKHCWQRIHVDFATFDTKDFLIVVDSYSKWLEVFHMKTTTSSKTIEKLRSCFSAYGLPCTLVSDGGPQLTSQEFNDFLRANGILHVVTPPYHPASNGLAERAVQTTKRSFLRQLLEDDQSNKSRTLQHRIDSFLFTYRNTPHTITGSTPAELFLRFKPRNHLSLLKPHLPSDLNKKIIKIENTSNKRRGSARFFCVGEKVFVRSVRQEKVNWLPGTIVEIVSPVTYMAQVDGRIRFVHADHLRPNLCRTEEEDVTIIPLPQPQIHQEVLSSPVHDRSPQNRQSLLKSPVTDVINHQIQKEVQPEKGKLIGPRSPTETVRRSQRERRPPVKFDL